MRCSANLRPGIWQVQVKEEALDANKHSHKLTRASLHTCGICGRLIATTYRETEKGELLIEELELDLKIVSSRISELRTATPRKYAHRDQPSGAVMTVEDTCW